MDAVNTDEGECSEHPCAPHGFNRNASHCEDRYVCDCEGWSPDRSCAGMELQTRLAAVEAELAALRADARGHEQTLRAALEFVSKFTSGNSVMRDVRAIAVRAGPTIAQDAFEHAYIHAWSPPWNVEKMRSGYLHRLPEMSEAAGRLDRAKVAPPFAPAITAAQARWPQWRLWCAGYLQANPPTYNTSADDLADRL